MEKQEQAPGVASNALFMEPGMVACAFDPSILWSSRPSLVYIASFKTARATQRIPVSKKKKTKQKVNK